MWRASSSSSDGAYRFVEPPTDLGGDTGPNQPETELRLLVTQGLSGLRGRLMLLDLEPLLRKIQHGRLGGAVVVEVGDSLCRVQACGQLRAQLVAVRARERGTEFLLEVAGTS